MTRRGRCRSGTVSHVQSERPGVWDRFIDEATGLAVYGRTTPGGELGAVYDRLDETGDTESAPVLWNTRDGTLQITLRALRNIGHRRDDMISQAVGWILGNTEAEDHLAKLRLTYKLAEAKVLIGLVCEPALGDPSDARFSEVLRLTIETDGFLFNGFRFRNGEGADLAWAVSAPATPTRPRSLLRRRNRRPEGRP